MSQSFSPFRHSLPVALACGLAFLPAACRKPAAATDPSAKAAVVPELGKNRLADQPSTLLREQASSPIHWQPWSRETFEHAEKSNRLVFALVIQPQFPVYRSTLKAMEADASLVRQLNTSYVPVIVDADACREIGILTGALCAEIKRPLRLPLLLWLTPQGDPVAWSPTSGNDERIRDLFDQSSNMVSRLWKDDPGYVLKNSRLDNRMRAERLAKIDTPLPAVEQPREALSGATRRLTSLYDPASRSLDTAGGLFPSSSLEFLASAAMAPDLPEDIRKRAAETTAELAAGLSESAMIDPLDGGVFNSRLGSGWNLPGFARDCTTQARAAISLLQAGRLTGNARLTAQALGILRFAETHYATPDGLFASGDPELTSAESWVWSLEDLEKLLSPEDIRLWTLVADLKPTGNIPVECDPTRTHFRRNSLAVTVPPDQAAARLGVTPEAAVKRFEASRETLLKAREVRLGSPRESAPRPHAGATFRMASAYAAAYVATGDPAFRDRATSTLTKARERFAEGPLLQLYDSPEESVADGRAFLYGLAMQAALDVADITLDPAWISWAENLAATTGERFLSGESLRELASARMLVDLPISDRMMLFDDSSAGLLALAEARLSQLGVKLPPDFATAVTPLSEDVSERPVLHTDRMLAALVREAGPVLTVAADAPDSLKQAVQRLPLHVAIRRAATPADGIPSGSVRIRFAGGREETVNSPDALFRAIPAGNPRG